MDIAGEMTRLAEMVRREGNASLADELVKLKGQTDCLLRQLDARGRRIAELQLSLEIERAMRAPRPQEVLARRCPHWRTLLYCITRLRAS